MAFKNSTSECSKRTAHRTVWQAKGTKKTTWLTASRNKNNHTGNKKLKLHQKNSKKTNYEQKTNGSGLAKLYCNSIGWKAGGVTESFKQQNAVIKSTGVEYNKYLYIFYN